MESDELGDVKREFLSSVSYFPDLHKTHGPQQSCGRCVFDCRQGAVYQ